MSAELDTKVSTLANSAEANRAASQLIIDLVTKLRADVAAASVDSPETLAKIDTITAVLTASAQALTAAVG